MKNNKSVTAVEWLHEKLAKSSQEELVGNINLWFKQAKEMEKQQIIKTWYDCKLSIIERNPTDAEQYYNETFKSE